MRPGAYPVWLFMSGWLAFAGSLVGTVFAVYFVTQVGLNPLQLIIVGTFMELTVFVFEIPTGAFADAYGRRLSVIVGFVLEGAGFAFAGAVPQFWAVVAGWCVWGVGATFESGAL